MKSLALLLATAVAAAVAFAPAPSASAALSARDTGAGADAATTYVCPMHPEVTSPTPGTCPKCNMKLVVKE
jgi:hypothetical protein